MFLCFYVLSDWLLGVVEVGRVALCWCCGFRFLRERAGGGLVANYSGGYPSCAVDWGECLVSFYGQVGGVRFGGGERRR